MDGDMLGYNVRRLRKGKGWTVRQLGDLAGLSGATISRIEAGRMTSETACEEVGVRPRGVASVANVMRRALAAAGLPPMRYHDLRGVCASLLLADGVDVRSVMAVLGHSDPSLTLAVYARVNPEQMQRAAESMGRLLEG